MNKKHEALEKVRHLNPRSLSKHERKVSMRKGRDTWERSQKDLKEDMK